MPLKLDVCPRCGTGLDAPATDIPFARTCLECGLREETAVFSGALTERFEEAKPNPSLTSEDAVCFHHTQHTASESCHTCGRFLCHLCAMRLHKETHCPDCIRRATHQSTEPLVRFDYSRNDRLALAIAFLPFGIAWTALSALFIDTDIAFGMFFGILFTTSFLTMPLALYLIVRRWKETPVPLGTARPRFMLALLLAGIQLCCWLVGIGSVVIGLLSSMGGGGA